MYSSAHPRDISDAAYMLMLLLADLYMPEHQGACVSIGRLAELQQKTTRQIINLIHCLEDAGYIRVYEDTRNRRASIYVVPRLPTENADRFPKGIIIPDSDVINQFWVRRDPNPTMHKSATNGEQTEEKRNEERRNKAAQQKLVSELKARDRRLKRKPAKTPPRVVGGKRA